MDNGIDHKKTPLVLLHGLGMSWRAWLPVIPLLEPQHDVHALTLAGHRGGPDPLPGRTDVAMLGDVVERELDARGLQRAYLVGNSLGAWVACELAQRGRARAVVAFSPPGAWRAYRDFYNLSLRLRIGQQMLRIPSIQMAMRFPIMRRFLLQSLLQNANRIPPEEVPEMIADMLSCSILNDLIESVRADGPLRQFVIDESCPVRLAWPAHDRTIPFTRYGKPFADLMPNAEIVPLSGVGHVPMYDNPKLVSETILKLTNKESGLNPVTASP